MKTWFTADLHFGHERIIELCGRPFSSVEEMNEQLLENLNSCISSSDRLIILGDICMGKLEDSLQLLKRIEAAELVLIPGNHDRWSAAYEHRGDVAFKREVFRRRYEEVRPGIIAIPDRRAFSAWIGANDFLFGTDHPLSRAWFSHYPPTGDSHTDEDRYAHLRPFDDGLPVVHGHVHTEWRVRDRQFNVGVDVNEFKPVVEDELVTWVKGLS